MWMAQDEPPRQVAGNTVGGKYVGRTDRSADSQIFICRREKGQGKRLDNDDITEKKERYWKQKKQGTLPQACSPFPSRISLDRHPVRNGFAVFLMGFLAAPCTTPTIMKQIPWAGTKGGARVQAVSLCDTSWTGAQNISITPDTSLNLTDIFACEGGEFNVSWSGSLNVSSPIHVGPRTTVRITGDGVRNTGEGGAEDTQSQLTELSSDLSISSATGSLISAVVGTRTESQTRFQSTSGVTSMGTTGASFGSIFFVDGGQLLLEGIAVRNGFAANVTENLVVSGGGVHAIESNITVSGCEFEDNFAQFLGGGIFANNSRVVVKNSVFRRCEAGYQAFAGDDDVNGAGGGIGVDGTDVLIEGCLFESCYASKKGGGMHQGVGQISILNSVFYDNVAGSDNVESEDAIGEGAGVSFTMCTLSFDGLSACGANDTTFINNNVARKGGAVVIGSGDGGTSRVEMHGCTFDNSTTGSAIEDDPQGEGGAISVAQGTTLVLDDCLLINNFSGKKGGALTLSSGENWEDEPGAVVYLRNSMFKFNRAELDNGGSIYLGEFSTVEVCGEENVFELNECGQSGTVLASSTDTRITVEGGTFSTNYAGETGGVFWVKGELNILGGNYSFNTADESGGVLMVSSEGTVTVGGGIFRKNEALDGGVAFVSEDASLLVTGGEFSGNFAGDGGGTFYVQGNGDINVTGGGFFENTADFGGFLYKEGEGNASCTGSSVLRHESLNGGAIYVLDGAILEWECDLGENSAVAGPAIYARAGATVNVRGASLFDNVAARGSVAFVVASTLRTYQVVFNDSSGSSDLSAVQVDGESTYKAEESSFVGFAGEVVVFSEGELSLNECDFSACSATELVYAAPGAPTMIRNAVLGSSNYAKIAQTASDAAEVPTADSLMNVNVTCEESDGRWTGSPCSEGSLCLNGDLGVYCQCYVRNFTREEEMYTGEDKCVSGYASGLNLTAMKLPEETLFPQLLEGGLQLSLGSSAATTFATRDDAAFALVSNSDDNDESWTAPSALSWESASGEAMDGVIWNVSAVSSDLIVWTVFPSTGLLRSGESIYLYAVGSPTEDFDGSAEVEFVAEGLSPLFASSSTSTGQKEWASGSSSSDGSSSILSSDARHPLTSSGRGDGLPLSPYEGGTKVSAADGKTRDGIASFDGVIYYHCPSGNYWNGSQTSDTTGADSESWEESSSGSCELCTEIAEGNIEGIDCSEPGASIRNLPIKAGYWRASLSSTLVRECYSEDACAGGSAVEIVQDYCSAGYEGPQCAVCSSGYGRGAASTCHLCTAGFKGWMYFFVSVASLLTAVMTAVLAIYLVGGRYAVSSTVDMTRKSFRRVRVPKRKHYTHSDVANSNACGDGSASIPHGNKFSSRVLGGKWFSGGKTSNDEKAREVDGGNVVESGGGDGHGGGPVICDETHLRAPRIDSVIGRDSSRAVHHGSAPETTSGVGTPAAEEKGVEAAGPLPVNCSSRSSAVSEEPAVTNATAPVEKSTCPAAINGTRVCSTIEGETDNNAVEAMEGAGVVAPPSTAGKKTPNSNTASSPLSLTAADPSPPMELRNVSRRFGPGLTASNDHISSSTQPAATNPAAEYDQDEKDSDGQEEKEHDSDSLDSLSSSALAVRGCPETARGSTRGAGNSSSDGEEAEEGRRACDIDQERGGTGATEQDKQRDVAARITRILGYLPLSKLKIVIVVWQISNAFADITQVPFPPIYEKFLSFLGVFSFDLSWIFSAACLTESIDFYDKLLLATIGPFGIICLLTITFTIGTRSVQKASVSLSDAGPMRNSVVSTRLSTRALNDIQSDRALSGTCRTARTADSESGRNTTNNNIHEGGKLAEEAPDETRERAKGGRGSRDSVRFAQTVLISRATAGSVGRNDEEAGGGMAPSAEISPPASPAPPRRGIGPLQRSVRGLSAAGPGSTMVEQRQRELFARHTTMTLVILYLVYTQISTVVFQTFACENFPETGKSYLRADLRIECNTHLHDKYKIYAAIMICIYPLGIPAAFCYLLVVQRAEINPATDKDLKKRKGRKYILDEKIKARQANPNVTPTSFLWSAYYPNRYFYEVCECIRRLLLTGLLVFLVPDTSGQVAFSCVFAFASLMVFELLRPHMDSLDMQLYRAGCLVIFFTNFLALMIKAEVADTNSRSSALYSLVLIVVNIFFALSIVYHTVVSVSAMSSTRRLPGEVFGVDPFTSQDVNRYYDAQEKKKHDWFWRRRKIRNCAEEDCEAPASWHHPSSEAVEAPSDVSSHNARNATLILRPSNAERKARPTAAADVDSIQSPCLSDSSRRHTSQHGTERSEITPAFGGPTSEPSTDDGGRKARGESDRFAGKEKRTRIPVEELVLPAWGRSNSSPGFSKVRSHISADGGTSVPRNGRGLARASSLGQGDRGKFGTAARGGVSASTPTLENVAPPTMSIETAQTGTIE